VRNDSHTALGRYAHIVAGFVALVLGILSLAAAKQNPVGSFAGGSTLGAVAELGAGWSLVAAGLLFGTRHPDNRSGPLLIAAGVAWFVPEWSNPGIGNGLQFTVGLVGFIACAPLVAHAAVAYPTGRLRSPLDRTCVGVAYAASLLLLGLLPSAVFDPKAGGCVECPRNLVLVHGDGGLFEAFNRYGLRAGIASLAAVGALLLWRLVRSLRAAAAVMVPALVSAMAYLTLVAWDFQHSLARGTLGIESFDVRIWRYEAAALAAFAFAVAWTLLRERQARASVARLVVELGQMPRPGAVRDALAQTIGDQTLELAYRRSETGAYVDAFGRSLDLAPGPGRAVTQLLRGATPVAALVHDVRLLDQPGLMQEVVAAARIAVENEQLQAEVRAQLEELRASRARIVETGDTERRRLERDLHDGAQQRLVVLSYDLGLARAAAETHGDPELTRIFASAGDKAQAALAELRELAHGIYPAILAEAGLEPALGTLADEAPLPVELGVVTPERFSPPVETAAYRAIAEAIDDAAAREATFISIDANRESGRLVVTVEDDGRERSSPLVHLADRIGAVGGSLELGETTLRAAIPCE
jgi:signal transduction histidine kinase